MTNQEQEIKEKKSFTEVLMDNRGKIITSMAIIGCGVCYIMGTKTGKNKLNDVIDKLNKSADIIADKAKEINRLKAKCAVLEDDIIDLYEDNQTLSSILSEGVLQDAIRTTCNKINSRLNNIKSLELKLISCPNDETIIKKIEEVKRDVDILIKRKDLYTTKLNMYEIKDLDK